MTDNNHPITPPLELAQKWVDDAIGPDYEQRIATQAARWGADMELEACCEWLVKNFWLEPRGKSITNLRDARRPKPPSLKEQALETLRSMEIKPVILDGINVNKEVMDKYDLIRRAIEALPD